MEPVAPTNDLHQSFPEDWQLVEFQSIADIIDPNPKHRNPKYVEEGFPFLSTAQFAEPEGFDLGTAKTVSEETVIEQEERCKFSNRSIAFSRKGTIGKTRILPSGFRFALLDSVCVINASSEINNEFINYAINGSYVQKQIAEQTRGVALKQVSLGVVRSLKFMLPPLREQEMVVNQLDRIFSVIYENEVEVEGSFQRAEQLRQSILKNAFSGQLVTTDTVTDYEAVNV